jgi:hypothetical protein
MKDKARLLKDNLVRITYNTKGHVNERTGVIVDYDDFNVRFEFDPELVRYIDYKDIIDICEL